MTKFRAILVLLTLLGGVLLIRTEQIQAQLMPGRISASQIVLGTLAVARGGTGLTTYTQGDVVYASAAGTLAGLNDAATGNALISGGAGAAPSYGKVGLTTHVTGVLPTANGGTGMAFWTAAGPTVARIFTFPDAAATVLTSAAAVTAAQGGTGADTSASSGVVSVNAGTWVYNNVLTATRVLYAAASNAVTSSASFLFDGTSLSVPSALLSSPAVTVGSGTGVTVNNVGEVRQETYKVSVTYLNFIANDVTADVTIATLPAKTFATHLMVDLTTPFVCAAMTCTTATLSMTCGKTAGGNQYLLSFDADAAAAQFGTTAAQLGTSLAPATVPTLIGDLGSWTTTTAAQCRLTSAVGNLGDGMVTNLTAGALTFYLTTTKAP